MGGKVQELVGSPVARGGQWSRARVGLVGRVRLVGLAIGRKYYPNGNPTRYKTTVQVQYRHTALRATGRKDGGMGEENCGGTIVIPQCGKPRRSFLQIFPPKSGEICKNTSTHLLHRHTHTAVKSDAPGRAGRRGAGGCGSHLQKANELKTTASVVALRAMLGSFTG